MTLAAIGRGARWIALGEAVPLVAAMLALPVLVERLGADRLGILSLAWVVIGYFSLFDLGVGRATTRLVAARLGEGRAGEIPGLVTAAILALAGLGLAGGALLAGLAPLLAGRVLRVPAPLAGEARATFLLLALAVPLVVVTSGLRGVLEARQRFGALAAMRAGLGLLSFLGPLAVLPFSSSLVAVVSPLAAGRAAALGLHLALCRDALPGRGRRVALELAVIPELLRYGGWLTVSNLVSPILVLLDRFVVGALVSIGAVAYYATPLEVVQRIGVIPIAIATVLFPAAASSWGRDPERASALYSASLRLSLIAVLPLLFAVSVWAPQGLALWLGPEFAREAAGVVRWVAPGLLLNALGCAALALLQAVGRADLTARFHVVELAAYVPLLVWLAARFGIEGAAVAWMLRVGADAALLLVAARGHVRLGAAGGWRVAAAGAAGLGALAAAPWLAGLGVGAAAPAAALAGLVAAAVLVLLTRDERRAISARLGWQR